MTLQIPATGVPAEPDAAHPEITPAAETQALGDGLSASDVSACPFCGSPLGQTRTFCAACGQPGVPLSVASVLHESYTILEVLSTSATGAVYRAQDKRRKRQVAIKELLTPAGESAENRAALQARFAREARRIAELKHPLLPHVYDSFSQDGRHYLVMSAVSGHNLDDVLVERGHGFGETQVRGWAASLLDLIGYLESRGFVHGEIAPIHLLLHPDGGLTLTGFGLAWRTGLRPRLTPGYGDDDTSATAGGRLGRLFRRRPGTAPRAGVRDDLYGLGVTLYALLTGHDAAMLGEAGVIPPVRQLAPQVSIGLSEVINRAASPDARLRFNTLPALQAALQLGMPARSYRSRRPKRLLALGAVVLLVAVATAVAVNMRQSSAPAGSSTPSSAATSAPSLPTHTALLDDAFLADSSWPVDNLGSFVRAGSLALTAPARTPARILRTAYQTGADGFTVEAEVRLVQGSPVSTYGMVVADQQTTPWENMVLLVRADGSWALERYHGGHAPLLAGWSPSAAIRRGHNTPNVLKLTEIPGVGGKPAGLSVTINGQQLARSIPLWSAAPGGAVGIVAGPGVTVAADMLGVSAPTGGQAGLDDQFATNRLGWHAAKGTPLPLKGGMLRLPANRAAPLRVVTAGSARFGKAAHTLVTTLTFNLHAPGAPGQQRGGIVFASAANAIQLAAVAGLDGRVAVVSLQGNTVRTLATASARTALRTGHGFNALQVTSTLGGGKVSVQLAVNGAPALSYSGIQSGLVRRLGVVVIGNAGLDASRLQVAGRGVSVQAS